MSSYTSDPKFLERDKFKLKYVNKLAVNWEAKTREEIWKARYIEEATRNRERERLWKEKFRVIGKEC